MRRVPDSNFRVCCHCSSFDRSTAVRGNNLYESTVLELATLRLNLGGLQPFYSHGRMTMVMKRLVMRGSDENDSGRKIQIEMLIHYEAGASYRRAGVGYEARRSIG